jgi:hypothetical protein
MTVAHGAIGAGDDCTFTSAVSDAVISTEDVSVARSVHVPCAKCLPFCFAMISSQRGTMRAATSVAPPRQMPHGPSSPCCRPRTDRR